MSSSGNRRLGMTGPLSEALPTPEENQMTDALVEELKRQNNYESATDTRKRYVVLDSLKSIAKEFVKQVCKSQGKPEHVVNNANAIVVPFGSFKLGVFGPGSDIDTLVVGPTNVRRADFFERFPDLLIKHAPAGAITDLTAVPGAYVPVLKFEYSGISIDLLYSHIDCLEQIPDDLNLLDNNILRGLELVDIYTLNGFRVCEEMLELVPQPAVFKTALRAVKLWAQRRAIYANIVGFAGGVAWAMLLARVCQLYPKATASTMVLKFFRIIETWQWPVPIQLRSFDKIDFGFKVWNPQIYRKDSQHLMPVLTPAYPSMCATNTVTNFTMQVMLRELKRGGIITDKIMTGKAQWKDLFAKHTFFTQDYKYYLSVISASTTKEAQNTWSGRVESRVRILVDMLGAHESIALARPFNKTFERVHKCHTEEEIEKVKEGSLDFLFKKIPAKTTDRRNESDGEVAAVKDKDANGDEKPNAGVANLKEEDVSGVKKPNGDEDFTFVYTTTSYIGLELHEGAKSLDLLQLVREFKADAKKWGSYNAELNAISVVHTRNYSLPDDVFSEGEVKPTRSAKKSKKRTAPEVGCPPAFEIRDYDAPSDTSKAPAKRQQNTSVAAAG